MKTVPETRRADRYETFVVRLWIEEGWGVRHGEISHLSSGTKSRIHHMRQAIDFMGKFVGVNDETSQRKR